MKTEEKKFVMLTNDLLFKETFGNPHNMKHLEDLLESYYGWPRGSLEGRVVCTYESMLGKSRLNDMSIRGDLVAIIDNKILVNMEMYSAFDINAFQKSEYYIMRIYSTQLDIGSKYHNLKKVTQINFVDDVNLEIEEEVKQTINKNTLSNTEMNIVRLDQARKLDYNNNDRFIKHLKFLGARTAEERAEIAKGDELLMELNEWIEAYSNDESVAKGFNDWEWNQHIYYNRGIEQGIEQKSLETAKIMLSKNMPTSEIAEIAGLSLEEINKLREEK